MNKLICWLFGHKIHSFEGQFFKEIDGEFCERCGYLKAVTKEQSESTDDYRKMECG